MRKRTGEAAAIGKNCQMSIDLDSGKSKAFWKGIGEDLEPGPAFALPAFAGRKGVHAPNKKS